MYSPYLYARRSELLALRSLLSENLDIDNLLPILEPVKSETTDIRRCMIEFAKKQKRLIIVVNPSLNDFSKISSNQKKFRDDIDDLFSDHASLIPGLELSTNTSKKTVEDFFKKYRSKHTALIYNNSQLTLEDLKNHNENPKNIYNITLNNKITTSQLSKIKINTLIHTNDDFIKKNRNADYHGKEPFTDRHNLVAEKALAFGDYTITGKKFETGGGAPGAVAIHTIYRNPKSSDIWIEHFISDETDQKKGSSESKFLEAAAKLVKQVKLRPLEFGQNSALDAYKDHVTNQTWPGLAKNKEYQIRHHIQFMLDILKK
ncbi:sce7725 family protein [Pseudomonas viridiflava]|uniref:sce7725 family protein n=1 Tax=Pseudomonas viridiflava TaxID=33069 RepID=UPI000F0284D2|nr:sce7725 family protein [Pseudomonas viridiflava]